MSNDILNKLQNSEELSYEEIVCALNYIVDISREYLKTVPISDRKKCLESNQFLYLCITKKFNIEYLPLSTNILNNDQLFHWFGVIIFNCKYHPISFLIDLTIDQFKYEPEYKDLFQENQFDNQVLKDVINKGYTAFTKTNFQTYINLFFSAIEKNAMSTNNKKQFLKYIDNEMKSINLKFNPESDFGSSNNSDIKQK